MPGLKLNLAKSNNESADGGPASMQSADFNRAPTFNAHVVVKSGDSSCSSLKIDQNQVLKPDIVERTQKKIHEVLKLMFENPQVAPELEVQIDVILNSIKT